MFNPIILLGLAPGCWWSVGIGWVLVTISAVIFVWNDTQRGNRPVLLWTLITIVFSFVGMFAYLIWKSTQPDTGWRG